MKLHVLSDLHLEHHPCQPAALVGDALLLAGDICPATDLAAVAALARRYLQDGRPVLYVAGNHEYYGQDLATALRRLHSFCRRHGIHFLHNRELLLGGVRFFGATAWTDFALFPQLPQARAMAYADAVMNDYRFIRFARQGRAGRLQPADTLRAHEKFLRLLQARLGRRHDGPTVIITHHAPHKGSIARRYAKDPITSAFVSDLSAHIETLRPALWVHGHTHTSFDYWVGNTRVVSNPRGYPSRRALYEGAPIVFENSAFDEHLVVEV